MYKLNRFKVVLFGLTILAMALAACSGGATPQSSGDLQGTVTVSGAWALYPMMTRWAEEFQKLHPDVQFDVSAGGAGKGMTDALGGAVDIGMVSRAISPEEEAKGAFWVPVVKDAVFPTINAQNPVLQDLTQKGIDQETLIGIYITGDVKTWGQVIGRPEVTDEIHVYTRSDACGAGETWAKYLGNKKQEDLQGIAVFGDPGLLEAVIKDPLGIGFNNLGYAYDADSGEPVAGAAVLPIDNNQSGQADADEILETKSEAMEMVANGKYPSPPARDLNLVTNGKPTGLVQAFMQWVITDGQKFVTEAGYVQLLQEQLEAGLQKLQ